MNKLYPTPLSSGGSNDQGVPLGLVNWMCLNRLPHVDKHDLVSRKARTTRVPRPLQAGTLMLGIWSISPTIWKGLALSKRGEFGNRGLVDIAIDNMEEF